MNCVRIIPCSLQEPDGDVKVGQALNRLHRSLRNAFLRRRRCRPPCACSGGYRGQRRKARQHTVSTRCVDRDVPEPGALGSRPALQDEKPSTEQCAQQPSYEDTPLLSGIGTPHVWPGVEKHRPCTASDVEGRLPVYPCPHGLC